MMINPLEGKTALIVEDYFLVAEEVASILKRAGCKVIGPAPNVQTALELVERTPHLDVAALDVNLGSEFSYDVADELIAREIPFLFMSGYGVDSLEPFYRTFPSIPKPFTARDFCRAMEGVLDHAAAGRK